MIRITYQRGEAVRRLFRKRSRSRDIMAEMAPYFAGHKATERHSISWHVNSTYRDISMPSGRKGGEAVVRERYNSNYAFSITWTPGTLTLAGDLGTLVLNHWQAMATMPETIRWLRNPDHDYLMGKSSAKKEFDAEATARDLIHNANEDAFEAAVSYWDEVQCWRRETAEIVRELAMDDPYAEVNEHINERPEPPQVRRRTYQIWEPRPHRDWEDWSVPDGWDKWHRLRDAVAGHLDENAIFTAQGRREIREDLEQRLRDGGPTAAADLCHELGQDDYYGSYSWPHQTYIQHAAIKHWVSLVEADYQPAQPAEAAA